jgi:outer membrane protein OmpA-like peptidoglycan-associated protein
MACGAVLASPAAGSGDPVELFHPAVYFELDSATVPAARGPMLDKVIAYTGRPGFRQVTVVAHADTSGTPEHNLDLSRRRALAVADALVARGLARDKIHLEWRGEAQPAVATGDGVPAPLNRRAVIDWRD